MAGYGVLGCPVFIIIINYFILKTHVAICKAIKLTTLHHRWFEKWLTLATVISFNHNLQIMRSNTGSHHPQLNPTFGWQYFD